MRIKIKISKRHGESPENFELKVKNYLKLIKKVKKECNRKCSCTLEIRETS